jgi:hypothetical protein
VAVKRLLELAGHAVELGVPTARFVQLAQFGEVVEQPVASQRPELERAQLAGQGQSLLADPPAFCRVLGLQKRRVEPHERSSERARLAEPTGHVERLGRQLSGSLCRFGEDELLRQARKDLDAQDAVAWLECREGLLQQRDIRLIGGARGVEPPARAQHGPCQPVG